MIAHIGGLEFEVFVSYASWNLVPGIIDSEYCYHLISLDVILQFLTYSLYPKRRKKKIFAECFLVNVSSTIIKPFCIRWVSLEPRGTLKLPMSSDAGSNPLDLKNIFEVKGFSQKKYFFIIQKISIKCTIYYKLKIQFEEYESHFFNSSQLDIFNIFPLLSFGLHFIILHLVFSFSQPSRNTLILSSFLCFFLIGYPFQ